MSFYETCIICNELYRCDDSFAVKRKMHNYCYDKLSNIEQCKVEIDVVLKQFPSCAITVSNYDGFIRLELKSHTEPKIALGEIAEGAKYFNYSSEKRGGYDEN